MTETSIPPAAEQDAPETPQPLFRRLVSRITRLEIVVGVTIAAIMGVLVVIEPNILEAPFENERTLLFTFGGTALAAIAFGVMLWFRVPAVIRVIVLVVPFALVNWWLISPYFIDDVVDESFSTSITEQLAVEDAAASPAPADPAATPTTVPAASAQPAEPTDPDQAPAAAEPAGEPIAEEPAVEEPAVEEPAPVPDVPVLLGAGQFVGLAGHEGTGDAGLFQNPDGTYVLRFENFDIENGPDLEVYLVPGADQTSLPDGSIGLGALKGNIGDQNYELPAGTELAPGAYTALVWCRAFSVEFVGATLTI